MRALFGGSFIFDTLESRHVWEHPYYPQFYVPQAAVKSGLLKKGDNVDDDGSAYLATLTVKEKSTDRVLGFEKGPLAGLIRFEFSALGMLMLNHFMGHFHPYSQTVNRRLV